MGRKKLLNFMKILQKYKYIAVVIAVGFFLLILPSGEGEKEEKKTHDDFDVKSFERRLEDTLSECNGVGRCSVILSVEAGPERVYEKESRKSLRENEGGVIIQNESDTKPSTLSEGSGRESALLVKELYPEFRGAVVICDGADRTDVKSAVGACVSSLTGLGSDRISIVKMKK